MVGKEYKTEYLKSEWKVCESASVCWRLDSGGGADGAAAVLCGRAWSGVRVEEKEWQLKWALSSDSSRSRWTLSRALMEDEIG